MKKILFFFFCICSLALNAQNYGIALYAGPNLSFLSVKSDYSFSGSDQYKPGFGFEIGVLGSLKISEKLNFDQTVAFQFVTHKDDNDIHLRDANDIYYYDITKHTINNGYIVLSPQLSYQINSKIYLGSGVNVNVLLYSHSIFTDLPDYFSSVDHRMNNTYYKGVNIGIPVLFGYNYKKFIFRLRYDIGISNLMKDSDSFFEEKENTISLDFGYIIR